MDSATTAFRNSEYQSVAALFGGDDEALLARSAEVARSLGVDRGTVAKYTDNALAAGLSPGGEQLSAERWAELVHEWFPELCSCRRGPTTHWA